MNNNNKNLDCEIQDIFVKNELKDLIKFIDEKRFYNKMNIHCIYLFYIFNSSSILISTLSSIYPKLLFLGVALNVISNILISIKKINDTYLKKLNYDLSNIKRNNYIFESDFTKFDQQQLKRPSVISNLNNI